jgi:hypothetical protein
VIPECARPRPLAGARPLESNAGASDVAIVAAPIAGLNFNSALPAELLEVAERIAERIVSRVRAGGAR